MAWHREPPIRSGPYLALTVMVLPVMAGLGLALWSGFGQVAAVLAWPGLPRAALLSLGPGVAATGAALALVVLILALRPPGFAVLEQLLAPLLALPHASAALGLAFLIAPSGWIARALSPWATGWTDPPDLLTLNDPFGLALTLGLVLKETPFLLLVSLGLVSRAEDRRRMVAATLGYGRVMGFVLAVWPGLYPQLRLPVLAVLVYAMTNVDMALILGPSLPHPLAVQISLWMTEPGLAHQGMASAGALVQLALVGLAIALWRGAEGVGHWLRRAASDGGARWPALDRALSPLAHFAVLALLLPAAFGLANLTLWSLSGRWPFPDALPQSLTLAQWHRAAPDLLALSATTLLIALAATLTALILTIAALRQAPSRLERLVYLPLIVPQVVFLPGLATALLPLPVPPLLAVLAGHLVFVLPYVFLTLEGPFRAWDQRIGAVAATLGAAPRRILWTLRLPMLAKPLATAAAIGIAVSIGQYLPTLMLGGGRITTLTTEAVALSSGANRRILGAFGLMQALWPALAFALARRVKAT